jgi:hypothetical protein
LVSAAPSAASAAVAGIIRELLHHVLRPLIISSSVGRLISIIPVVVVVIII